MSPRVQILTSVHRWNDPRIFSRQARTLAAAGYEVGLRAPGAPTATIDDVAIGDVSAASGRIRRMTVGLWQVARKVENDCEVVHVHDPELLLLVPYLRVRRRRTKIVYDAHEDYAAQLRDKPWIPRIIRRPAAVLFGALELVAARGCDLVVAATPQIARRFPSDRTVVVQNYPEVGDFPEPRETSSDDVPVVVHVGELNSERGAASLSAAADGLKRTKTARVLQIGPVKPSDLVESLGATIETCGTAPHRDVLETLSSAAVAVVLFRPSRNHVRSQPNKLFEYLALGLPVVASDFDHWRTLAQHCDARVSFVDPDDAQQVEQAIRTLIDQPDGDRSQRAERARHCYSWEAERSALLGAYDRLLG